MDTNIYHVELPDENRGVNRPASRLLNIGESVQQLVEFGMHLFIDVMTF